MIYGRSRLKRILRSPGAVAKTAASTWAHFNDRRHMGNWAARRLVWFLVPSEDKVGGGVMSICSIHEETRKLLDAPDVAVVASTYPNFPRLAKYTGFLNTMKIFAFASVRNHFHSPSHVTLHLPEYFCRDFYAALSVEDLGFFRALPRLHINILLQNIDLLNPSDIEPLHALTQEITCTTAHDRYSTREQGKRLGIALHKVSVFMNDSLYEKCTWSEKEDIIVISPDFHPMRDAVIDEITSGLPHLRVEVVRDMSYENYRALITRAKWSLTFGEGLDGYFAEMAWTRGVPFAVYNDRFFMPEFRGLPTVYETWDRLRSSIASHIRQLDHHDPYTAASDAVRKPLNDLYSSEEYRRNLRAFYDEDYSYPLCS